MFDAGDPSNCSIRLRPIDGLVITAMSSSPRQIYDTDPYHPDLDGAYNDAVENLLPYAGGDIPNTELGFCQDMFAELNEPVDQSVSSSSWMQYFRRSNGGLVS